MKQIIQNLNDGRTIVEDVPVPNIGKKEVLIKTHRSLISKGTEKMLVNFGRASYLAKARQQPDKVKQVLDKIKTDGLQPTVKAVLRKLNAPIPLGYCNAGEIIAVGTEVTNFQVGDRVASNGPHAEVIAVSENLVAKIPDEVSYEEAAFTVVGAIALQGIRLAEPTFGETIVVTGLGLIGLITVQLLEANGCNVIGIEVEEKKITLARSWGIEVLSPTEDNVVERILRLTGGQGADACIITASSSSDEIISQAAKSSRKRGRIILVGVIGLNLKRSDFYEKELSFQVSCSYGPGRYDVDYESKAMEYPIGYVRWTENRNFQAILEALRKGNLRFEPLISRKINLPEASKYYQNIDTHDDIATIIEYDHTKDHRSSIRINQKEIRTEGGDVIGIIGAGNFTKSTVLPLLAKEGLQFKYISSSKGLSGTLLARKYKIENAISDYQQILEDESVNGIVITTRHDMHAHQVIEALRHNKHVFVEKPLALNAEELDEISKVYQEGQGSLSVGFNRRFSPFTDKIRTLIGKNPGELNISITVNAGKIPADHWTQDPQIGGGRIIGEACHFIDLISYLSNSKIRSVVASSIGINPSPYSDNVMLILRCLNGSQGSIKYVSNGHKSYAKERVEIFYNGKTIIIDNFRKMICFGFPGKKTHRSTQDKGHKQQFKLWADLLRGSGAILIPFDEIMNTSRATLACLDSIRNQDWIEIGSSQ